jgi:ankyrin repeat protein
MRGHLAAADWLLARGADVNARPPFDHHATPLHWAALNGHADVAKLLVSRGADRAARDRSFDATAQGWAAHNGHAALAELLRE